MYGEEEPRNNVESDRGKNILNKRVFKFDEKFG